MSQQGRPHNGFNHRTKALCGRQRERGQHLSTVGDVQKCLLPTRPHSILPDLRELDKILSVGHHRGERCFLSAATTL